MRTAVLLGNKGTKRTIYFEKAARRAGLPLLFLEWDTWRRQGFGESGELFVKIDPPVWTSCRLSSLNGLADSYRRDLMRLQQESASLRFLNEPRHLMALLDKRECKRTLLAAGLPVTQAVSITGKDSASLLLRMKEERVFQVFLKPVSGSGAAGVTALRYQPSSGRMAAYTCAMPDPSASGYDLINTKQLRRFTEPAQVLPLLDALLSMDCIVERWYPKAESNGFSYDLRAVCQEGTVDFLLARLSKGPITNLHLNNHPMAASELGLLPDVTASIEELCRNACRCYPGLKSAGIDLLLERGSLKPRIIEMNGQGDLLYQDIYEDNRIYDHQARMMKRWCDQELE